MWCKTNAPNWFRKRSELTKISHFQTWTNSSLPLCLFNKQRSENTDSRNRLWRKLGRSQVCSKSRYVEFKGFARKLSTFRLLCGGQTMSGGLPHLKLSAQALLASIIDGVAKCQGPPLLGVNPQILSCQRLVALTNCNLQGTPLPLTHI